VRLFATHQGRGPERTRRLAACLAATVLAGTASADPVVVDTARGPVEVAEVPRRVVVLDMAALDTIDALGVRPVGVPEKVFVPYLEAVAADAEAVGTLFEPEFEAVAALEPDLIVVGGRSSAQYDALSAIAPVIDMTIGDGTLLEEARARILGYGALFGREAAAAALEAELDAGLAAAREAVADKGSALIVMTNGPKVSAYGPGSRFGWVHTALGLEPAVEDVEAATHGEAISFEFIHATDPAWLLVVDRAAAIGEEAASARETLDNPLVAETTAWENGQIVYLDAAPIYIAGGGVRSLGHTLDEITAAFSE
jgi:iron complex transport system substrate-binding protein